MQKRDSECIDSLKLLYLKIGQPFLLYYNTCDSEEREYLPLVI